MSYPSKIEKVLLQEWQWQLGALAVFLAWLDLILFLGNVPWFGIYILMFIQVLRTFIFFLPILILFVAAFAFAFFMLLQNHVSIIDGSVLLLHGSWRNKHSVKFVSPIQVMGSGVMSKDLDSNPADT